MSKIFMAVDLNIKKTITKTGAVQTVIFTSNGEKYLEITGINHPIITCSEVTANVFFCPKCKDTHPTAKKMITDNLTELHCEKCNFNLIQ